MGTSIVGFNYTIYKWEGGVSTVFGVTCSLECEASEAYDFWTLLYHLAAAWT